MFPDAHHHAQAVDYIMRFIIGVDISSSCWSLG